MPHVVLSLGMGVDSVGILTRWLTEPETRDFDLSDLVVLTAQVGAEYRETADHMQRWVLPLMRRNNVRYVQLSRGGQYARDRYVVLDDSTQPQRMYMSGPWTLTDYQMSIGSVPQFAGDKRDCSRKAKGQPLDWWREDHIDGAYEHVIGFSAEEGRRILKDKNYTTASRSPRFPLFEWGWDRSETLGFLHQVFGVVWPRSCCVYCPFAIADPDYLIERWRAEPEGAALALQMEQRALAVNPRAELFKSSSALQLVLDHDVTGVLDLHRAFMAEQPWEIYDVRRIYFPYRDRKTEQLIPTKKGHAYRSVKPLMKGPRAELSAEFDRRAAANRASVVHAPSGVAWAHLREPSKNAFPTVQHLYALGPAGIKDKRRDGFYGKWSELVDQTTLFAAA